MTSHDAIPDREELRQSGDHRTRRGRRVLLTVMAGLLVLTPIVLVLADHGAHPAGRILTFGLLPAAVFVAVGLPMTWWVRRRHPHWQTPPLSAGANRDTRRAIRTGHAPDARVDALAREQAEQTVRNTVVLKIYAALLALQLGLLVLRIINGGPTDILVLAVLGDTLWAAGVAVLVVTLSRSRRYLRDHPRESRSR